MIYHADISASSWWFYVVKTFNQIAVKLNNLITILRYPWTKGINFESDLFINKNPNSN